RGYCRSYSKRGQSKLFFLEVDDQRNEKERQQVKKMDSQGKSKKIGDEDKPAFIVGFVMVFGPDEGQPDHHGGEEHGRCIHFSFYCIKPEGVSNGKRERSDNSSAIHSNFSNFQHIIRYAFPFTYQADNNKVEEHDC